MTLTRPWPEATVRRADAIFPTGGAPVADIVPSGAGYRAAITLVLPAHAERP